MATQKVLVLFFSFWMFVSSSYQIQLILVNNCNHSVWPGTLGNAGHDHPRDGGFHLAAFEEAVFDVPTGWSGRLWGRTGCCFDERGRGSCATGDCGGGLRCAGAWGVPPATVVEMTLGTAASSLHFYDVSLVDGFNVPLSMTPVGGGAGCGVAVCDVDLNACCPAGLVVERGGRVVGCNSACLALRSDKYCCTGEYGSPARCRPTLFSRIFKSLCPRAYSYAFDDATSLNKCTATRYLVTFCPPAK
ncbi:thaumatin-like protein [Zingiber officinale]|uniref:Thaumatin-like protein n=1 Tax=Zingiber officinale TaxID=94328 RepID=A0A8J5L5N9_ZINOF|nr:thaumatin-like protein [Zingiber officinale]KAG6506465.1 hypothetical protein ZIOFF_031788 [Zingiber officinale]